MTKYGRKTVSDIPNDDDVLLITGNHERDIVLEHIGVNPEDYSHMSLFVRVNNGEYEDVWAFPGNVPYLNKNIEKLI